MMRIDVITHDGTTTIKPHGRLDATTGSMMQDTLLRVASSDTSKVLLDLSAVPAISSAGLAPSLSVLARLLEQSLCEIEGLNSQPKQFLEKAGVLRLMELFQSLRLHQPASLPGGDACESDTTR